MNDVLKPMRISLEEIRATFGIPKAALAVASDTDLPINKVRYRHHKDAELPTKVLDALHDVVDGGATIPIWRADGPLVYLGDELLAVFVGPNAKANAAYVACMRGGDQLMIDEIDHLRAKLGIDRVG